MAKPLLDILYRWNCCLSNTSQFLESVRFNSAMRFGIRLAANNILPALYSHSRRHIIDRSLPIVVSLTSFPARINRVWIVIESMLRQTPGPERIVLWLSKDQFPNELNDLPENLVSQTDRGLEIRFVEGDIRSHKKYYYAFTEFKDKYILTIDDDLLFPSTFVNDVYVCAKRHNNSVIANFGSKFRWENQGAYLGRTNETVSPEETGGDLFFGSGGGTLFSPKRLLPFMDDIETIMTLCPTADDIYLNSLIRLAGMEVTFMGVFPLLSITNSDDVKLTSHNGNLYSPSSANSVQLRALVRHCQDIFGRNPFDV